GSMVTREAAGTIITHAGPEIGVASSKAFTCQLTALFLLAMYLGQAKEKLDESSSRCLVQELLHIPGKLETVLSQDGTHVVLGGYEPSGEESRMLYEKTLSNIQEVKAREGIVVALATEGDRNVAKLADHVIEVPASSELLLPILEVVPLQLLAYHIAVRRG